jgi:hypothetical protein
LGRQARAYTSAAATGDDLEAVRAHLDIPKLDLYGVTYGTQMQRPRMSGGRIASDAA